MTTFEQYSKYTNDESFIFHLDQVLNYGGKASCDKYPGKILVRMDDGLYLKEIATGITEPFEPSDDDAFIHQWHSWID